MFRKACLLSGAAFFLAAICLPGTSKGGPPPPPILMRADFGDFAGDLIKSDGGPYVDGVSGVKCDINPNTGDFRLNLNFTKKTARQVYAFLGLAGQAQTACSPVNPPPIPPDPLGCGFVNVKNLLSLTSGEWQETGAFLVAPTGVLRFNPKDDVCSTTVLARHYLTPAGKDAWEIRAIASTGPGVPDHDIAVLQQSSNTQTVPDSYYPLPFTLIVQRL